MWTSFPLSLSLSPLCCSVPAKIFSLKQRVRDGGPTFTPSDCINVRVKNRGAAGLKLSSETAEQRDRERRKTDDVLHAHKHRASELSCRVK